jgi:hypothetical protein
MAFQRSGIRWVSMLFRRWRPWLGTWALSFAVFAWCTLGCYLGLVLAFGDKPRSTFRCFLIGTVFLLFSGANIVGAYLVANFPKPPMPFMHFEWWSGFGAFPSAITSIFWTPQHLIAGWVAAFFLSGIRSRQSAVRA